MGWFKRLRNNREVEATLSTRNIRFSRHSLPQLNIQLSPLRLVRPQSSGLLLMRPTNGRGGKGVGVWTKTRNSLYPPRGYRALGCSALRLKEECTELLVIAAWNKVARHNNLIWVIYRALATSKDKGRRNSVICLASFSPPCSLFFLSLFLFFPPSFFSISSITRFLRGNTKARGKVWIHVTCLRLNYKDVTGLFVSGWFSRNSKIGGGSFVGRSLIG